jgi:hypothetical protein
MNRLLVVASLVCATLAAAACGSATAPANTFNGTYNSAWAGESEVVDTLQATQSGTTITGTDVEHVNGGAANDVALSGSVTGNTVTFAVTSGSNTLGNYKGTFTSSTVVTGYFYYSPTDSIGLVWTKE